MFSSRQLLSHDRWTGPNGRTEIRIFGYFGRARKGDPALPAFLQRPVLVYEGPPADRPRLPDAPMDPDVVQKFSSRSVIIVGIEVVNTSTGPSYISSSQLQGLPLSSLIARYREGLIGGKYLQIRLAGERPAIHVMGGGVKNLHGEWLHVWRVVFGRSPGRPKGTKTYSPEELLVAMRQALHDLKDRNPHARRNLKTPVARAIGTTYRQLHTWLSEYSIDFDEVVASVFDEER